MPPGLAELVGAWRQARGYVVAVSDETGLGVVPATPAGRLFRDELGRLNQALAAESEEAELIVAGRVLPLEDRTKETLLDNSPMTICARDACYTGILPRCLLRPLAAPARWPLR